MNLRKLAVLSAFLFAGFAGTASAGGVDIRIGVPVASYYDAGYCPTDRYRDYDRRPVYSHRYNNHYRDHRRNYRDSYRHGYRDGYRDHRGHGDRDHRWHHYRGG